MENIQAQFRRYVLHFRHPSGTSRGVMSEKETFFIILKKGDQIGVGEAGILRSLSYDDTPGYEQMLAETCACINLGEDMASVSLEKWPSIRAGIEAARLSLETSGQFIHTDFTQGEAGIPINGLIWMGDPNFMKEQIEQKLEQGFHCIKLKIGAIDFESEYAILKELRNRFSRQTLEIRVDANGGFSFENAPQRLEALAKLHIHSIEQPIRAGQWERMASLCASTPLPIALDEELIGVFGQQREQMLDAIQPQYIILKPSLLGGFEASEQWIQMAKARHIGWWITSALESNIGLDAIARWTYTLGTDMPQGLGTGSLYTNNIPCPLYIENASLWCKKIPLAKDYLHFLQTVQDK